MAEGSITIAMPRVTGAEITPNPAAMNTAVLIQVTAAEVSVTLEPEIKYAGEYYSGEV